MDTNKEIAISKIADILSSSNLIHPEVDIWKKIFNNAGLGEEYEYREGALKTEYEQIDFNYIEYHHNTRCYSALYNILYKLANNMKLFLQLINSIVDKINIYSIFDKNIEDKLDKRLIRRNSCGFDIELYTIIEKNNILKNYPSKKFKILRSNLNMLNLDIEFTNDGLVVVPFTNRMLESSFDDNILMNWLENNYVNIKNMYIKALENYSNGNQEGCISHCRNVITGIFSNNKEEQTKWKYGLKKACDKDKNIENIENIDDILLLIYGENNPDKNKRYQYPRYNLIYSLYTFCCALGSHCTEGNMTEEGVDSEITDIEDAFLALRVTEDILIWLYQTNTINN